MRSTPCGTPPRRSRISSAAACWCTPRRSLIPYEAVVKNWYNPAFPIVHIQASAAFDESPEWSKNTNPVARLLNAEVSVDSSLIALGRSCRHEGFDQFFSAASIVRD